MNKKMTLLVCGWLMISILPISTVTAGTVEDTPTTESALPSMSDDLLTEKQNTPTTPSIQEVPEIESEPIVTEEPPVTEKPKDESTESGKQIKPFGGGGIGPQTMNLIEGRPGDPTPYDIDADFADALRATVPGWSSKPVNGITDDDMNSLTVIMVQAKNLTDLKGISYARNLLQLFCYSNEIGVLDLSGNKKLFKLSAYDNNLTHVNLAGTDALVEASLSKNNLTSLNVNGNKNLSYLDLSDNPLTSLILDEATNLEEINLLRTRLTTLDVSKNKKLKRINANECEYLENVKLAGADDLEGFYVSLALLLTDIDVSQNKKLKVISIIDCGLTTLKLAGADNLETLIAFRNNLSEIDVSKNIKLKECRLDENFLNEIDVSKNINLEKLTIGGNQISDITSAQNLSKLTYFDANNQVIQIAVPTVVNNETTINILKTSAESGLSAVNDLWLPIIPNPTISCIGDQITLSGVTRDSLSDKAITFSYTDTQLSEGANPFIYKAFGGLIRFHTVSELNNELKADVKKTKSDQTFTWTWTITSLTTKKAQNIKSTLNLPVELELVPGSVKIDGIIKPDSFLDGGTVIGDLDENEQFIFTFETIGEFPDGSVDDWLTVKGRLDWEDDTITSPYFNEGQGKVQIQDDEQTYTPQDTKDMAILSVPEQFNYGFHDVSSTPETYQLSAFDYKSNTEVTTKGFYTRIKDDRPGLDGWKLTLALSEFKHKNNSPMPFGSGASLSLNGMSIESVTDRDTENEQIDPSPTVGVPGLVETNKTIVAGQTAQTLISADASGTEGKGTWQLRMPFNQISLNLPANAGMRSNVYNAKLTWSLDSTP